MRPAFVNSVLIPGLLGLSLPVAAHHSFATHFDLQSEVVIVGEVTEISLRNPHSYFSVEVVDDSGQRRTWEVESMALAILGRSGVTNDTLQLGDQVVFRGMPSLDPRKRFMFANEITPPGQDTVDTWASLRLQSARVPDNRPGISGIDRFTGRWIASGPGGQQTISSSPLPLNEVGRAAHEQFETRNASAAECVAPNLPAILAAPYLYEITHEDGHVVLKHEYNDVVRDVVVGGDEPRSSDPEFGQRTAVYEDEKLTVTSSGFPPLSAGLASNWEINGNGADVPSSERKVFVEQYSINEDGSQMRVDYSLTDPVYMTETYNSYYTFARVSIDTPFYVFDCDADIARRSIDHAVR